MKWLRKMRRKQGLSAKELAKSVGCSEVYIHKLESGERTPSVDTAKKIAKVLGFDWTRFYDDEQENVG